MKLSFIIPFRDRHEHLAAIVPHLRKYVDAEIIVAEQVDANALRRGALRNEGFNVATGDVLVFHDVDYVPDANVNYWPDTSDVYRAVHRVEFVNMDMTPRVDVPSGYRNFKEGIDDNFYGGVLCIKRDAFRRINGYNPLYQGWGLEDDDFRERIRSNGLKVESGNGTFYALPHPDSFKNDELFRHNQQLFHQRDTLRHVGLCNTTVRAKLNAEKAKQYGVDKWVDVTDWQTTNSVKRVDVVEPNLSHVDYGVFALLKNTGTDHVQKAIQLGIRWEPEVMALCEKYVKPGSTVLDIGANMGTFTVRLSQLVGPNGIVRAFEPQRIISQQLAANVFLNNCHNVYIDTVAISNKNGFVTLTPINYDNGAPGSRRPAWSGSSAGDGGEVVECTLLDVFHFDNLSLIKMDVERYEPFVFEGARHTIAEHRPVILFELTTLPLPDYPENYVLNTLESWNYNVYQITDAGDYLALPRERDDNL